MAEASQLTREVLVQHAAFVRARLRRLGVPTDALDDATQDVFEVLVRRIADYDHERPLRAWLTGIARRVARRHRGRPRFPPALVPSERQPSPEERAARAQAWGLLERFAEELEPERWSVFVLSELEGLHAGEIASELRLNPNTVSSRLRSARTSFERVLRRHHARERRDFVLAPWLGTPRSGAWALGCLGSACVLMIGAPRCRVDGSEPTTAVAGTPDATERMDVHRAVAATPDDRDSDPANARAPASGDDGWHPGGHGFSTLAGVTLSHERRYRFDGSTVTFETIYLGNDDIAATITGEIELDGLEPVAGELEWHEPIAAGQTQVRRLQANASRDGIVGLRLTHTHGAAGDSSTEFRWMHAGGVLRRCVEHECEPPPVEHEQLSGLAGRAIDVELVNTCNERVEFMLIAGPVDRPPPEHFPIHSLEPDEHRRATIDSAQWIRRRDAGGRWIAGGVRTGTPGSVIRFFESSGAGDCDGLSTTGPPPA
jgi:RNA polymerase sigma-70 factor (ECF subfamily)